jgi:hypothetical protein
MDMEHIARISASSPATASNAAPPGKRGRRRRRRRPGKLHADKGYDYQHLRRWLSSRGIQHRIARKGIESSQRLGRHRWVVHADPQVHIRLLTAPEAEGQARPGQGTELAGDRAGVQGPWCGGRDTDEAGGVGHRWSPRIVGSSVCGFVGTRTAL